MYKSSKHIFFVFFKYESISYESISKIHCFVSEMALLEKPFWNVIPVPQEMFSYWVLFLLKLIPLLYYSAANHVQHRVL